MMKRLFSVISLVLALIIVMGAVSFGAVSAGTAGTITIDGKEYKVSAGDEITYTYTLRTPNCVESIQAVTFYDETKLQLVPGTSREMFPVLRDMASVVYNADVAGRVKFNAMENVEGGFDFTEGGVLAEFTFIVLDNTGGYVYTMLEEMDEFGTGVRYVENSEVKVDQVTNSVEIQGNTEEETTAPATQPATTEAPVITEPDTTASEDATLDEPDYSEGILIDGKEYKASAGDEITYTYILRTPNCVESIQAATYYDETRLQFVPGTSREMFPVLRDMASVVYNTDLPGRIKFNAVENFDGGFDFTEGGVLVSFTFRVLDGTGGYIYTKLEEMDEFGTGVRYVEGSEVIVEDITASGTIEDATAEDTTAPVTTKPDTTKPADTTAASGGNIVIGDKDYNVAEGQIITYTYELKTPEAIECIQGTTYYDETKLQLIPGKSRDMFPVLRDVASVVYNTDLPGRIKFNAMENFDGGFDFTEGATLVVFEFLVLDASETTIYTQIEEAVEFGGKVDYITDGEIVFDGVEGNETLVDYIDPEETQTETTTQEVTETTTVPTYTFILGDVVKDEDVNIKDATLIQKAVARLETLTEYQVCAADVDENTDVNIKDATYIQKYVARIDTPYPIGETKTIVIG